MTLAMHCPTRSDFPTSIFNKLVCLIAAFVCALFGSSASARRVSEAGALATGSCVTLKSHLIRSLPLRVLTHNPQNAAGLRFELPANGNVRVENFRGAVAVEVWAESYVSVAVIADNGQQSATPPIVD